MTKLSLREYPAPVPNVETQPFWDAAKEGRLLLKHCTKCEKAHWYPRLICPFCGSNETEWKPASGRGILYTYSVMRRAAQPFAAAYVTLKEGPTMLTNIVDCDADSLSIGMSVEVFFAPTPDENLFVPVFRPIKTE